MRNLALSVFVVFCLTTPRVADAQTKPKNVSSAVIVAKKPSLVCPNTDVGDDSLQVRYTEMWGQFSKDVDEATTALKGELENCITSARDSGNLDLVLFWKTTGKEFEQTGELRWDEVTLRKAWSDRFGDASFPTDFSVAVKKASEAYKSAQQGLEKGYGELVAELTKAAKDDEAVKVRAERTALLVATAPAQEPKPGPKPVPQKPITYVSSLNATAKRLTNNWFEIGSVWGQPIIQGGQKGDHSIFLHAKRDSFSAVSYQLARGAESFESGVVVPKVRGDQGNPATPLIFQVWGDGRLLWKSRPVATMNQMQTCRVGVKGVTTLDLRVVCPGPDTWAVAVWFEPSVVGER